MPIGAIYTQPETGRDIGAGRQATTALGELVHIDPLGKARVACSLGGHNSALVMVDFSRFVVVELLHRKMGSVGRFSEILQAILQAEANSMR